MERILFISPSTLDRKNLIMTLLVCVFPILIFGWFLCKNLLRDNMQNAAIHGIFMGVFLAILIMGIICTPYKYILTNTHLIIKRHFKDIAIPLQTIKTIRLMTAADKKGMIRTFGADGTFGSFGYYQSVKHKGLNVYARRQNNWTLIITDQKKYVIAPDDILLIDAVTGQIGHFGLTNEEIEETKGRLRRMVIPIVILACILFMLISIARTYHEPKVICDTNGFQLNGIWGMDISLTDIASVDTMMWEEMPGISLRTNGVSLPGLHRGHFKTNEGQKVRMSIRSGISPVIRITDNNGMVYYINRKNPNETRQIFNDLQNNIKTN